MVTAKAVLMDFGLMSILLVVAHLLRSRIKLLQNALVPTSIIAGFLGLFGGYQFLDWLPFSMQGGDARAPTMDLYPGLLVVLLFATLFMGQREKKAVSLRGVVHEVGDTFFYNLGSQVGMYGLALLFGIFVLAPLVEGVEPVFAVMLPVGFAGGHGTATALGDAFAQRMGWEDALTIGATFATVGVLSAIAGGMVLINLATRRGWTRLVRSAQEVPAAIRQGFVPKGQREPVGHATVSPIALDPAAWHVALAFVAFALAFYVKGWAKGVLPEAFVLPTFCLAMLVGAAIQKSLEAVKLGQYVDRPTMVRIGSSVSDYLIAFAIASLKIAVVKQYALPLVITCAFGLLYCFAFLWFVGRRLFHNYWFERSLFTYGWNTGVVSIAIALLRVVDPTLRSRTLEDYSLAYVFISVIELVLLVSIPMMLAAGWVSTTAIVCTAGLLVCVVGSRLLVGWYRQPPDALREGEEPVAATPAELEAAGAEA